MQHTPPGAIQYEIRPFTTMFSFLYSLLCSTGWFGGGLGDPFNIPAHVGVGTRTKVKHYFDAAASVLLFHHPPSMDEAED